MDAPNWVSSVAPTKARIMPMRKLIRATMPRASGPHCCMTRSVSDQRNCARPRSSLQQRHHALAQEAEHRRAAGPGLEARLADPLEEGSPGVPARGVGLFRHGLGRAQSASPGRPAGSAARNSTFAFGAQVVERQDAHHQGAVPAAQPLRLELQGADARRRPVPSPPPRRPAGPNDPASRRRSRRLEHHPLSAGRSVAREWAQE